MLGLIVLPISLIGWTSQVCSLHTSLPSGLQTKNYVVLLCAQCILLIKPNLLHFFRIPQLVSTSVVMCGTLLLPFTLCNSIAPHPLALGIKYNQYGVIIQHLNDFLRMSTFFFSNQIRSVLKFIGCQIYEQSNLSDWFGQLGQCLHFVLACHFL